jgi:hypothetical protein
LQRKYRSILKSLFIPDERNIQWESSGPGMEWSQGGRKLAQIFAGSGITHVDVVSRASAAQQVGREASNQDELHPCVAQSLYGSFE